METYLSKAGLGILELSGLAGAYNFILATARSKKDIEVLHNLLPANCRLLRDDLLKLKKLWQDLYSGNPPKGGKRLLNKVCQSMLESLCLGFNLTAYYMANLVDKGKKGNFGINFNFHAKNSLLHNSRFGVHNFITVKIWDTRFEIICEILGGKFIVQLLVSQKELTEKLTHRILKTKPITRTEEKRDDMLLKLIYILSFSGKIRRSICKEEHVFHNQEVYVISPGFQEAFIEVLEKTIKLRLDLIDVRLIDSYNVAGLCILLIEPPWEVLLPNDKVLQVSWYKGKRKPNFSTEMKIPSVPDELIDALVDSGRPLIIESVYGEKLKKVIWEIKLK